MWSPSVVSSVWPSFPRAATPAWSVAACPSTARWSSVSAGSGRWIAVDEQAGQVTAGAGVTLGDLQAAARAAGWSYGVDMASRDSATVGGTVATNAGGLRVVRYGDTRAQVLGLEAVLGSGEVISHLGGLVKDNTGYHWPSLVCGSEGTLAVVTAARLRLVPPVDAPDGGAAGLPRRVPRRRCRRPAPAGAPEPRSQRARPRPRDGAGVLGDRDRPAVPRRLIRSTC